MLSELLTGLAALGLARAAQYGFTLVTDLPDHPYAVFSPALNASSTGTNAAAKKLPPLVFLHGAGSVYDQPSEIPEVLSYGGPPHNVKLYSEGNMTADNVVCTESFFHVWPAMRNVSDSTYIQQSWNLSDIYPVVQDALQRFADYIDNSSLLLTGYSAGGRAVWDVLTNTSSDYNWTRAASVAGVANQTLWPLLPNLTLPMQIWRGDIDYDPDTDLQQYNDLFAHLGNFSSHIQLENVTDGDHTNLQWLAYDVTQFDFLLGPSANATTASNIVVNTTASTSAASSTTTMKSSAARLRPRLLFG